MLTVQKVTALNHILRVEPMTTHSDGHVTVARHHTAPLGTWILVENGECVDGPYRLKRAAQSEADFRNARASQLAVDSSTPDPAITWWYLMRFVQTDAEYSDHWEAIMSFTSAVRSATIVAPYAARCKLLIVPAVGHTSESQPFTLTAGETVCLHRDGYVTIA